MQIKTKTTTLFRCTTCDTQTPKWSGQCFECSNWGTIEEVSTIKKDGEIIESAVITPLQNIVSQNKNRTATGINEIDRVFGGGIVPGSVTLLGGEPGIGKSTLSLGIAALIGKTNKVVYVSGEESGSQIKLRADRLGVTAKNLFFIFEQDINKIIKTLEETKPSLVVIDSIQTMVNSSSSGEAGSVGQIKSIAGILTTFAKATDTPIIIIGHITKDGALAGPKTLEHLVDIVLSFEGERASLIRFLRSLKNRFGSTDEVGIFSMTETGLAEVKNPSALLLDDNNHLASGSILTCLIEGVRPFLAETQALVQRTSLGFPTRRATGFDAGRLEMILAVLNRHAGIDLGGYDVFVNIAGGIKSKEPATDLAVALAIVSSFKNKVIKAQTIAWGEIGLGGELRTATATDKRVSEATNLGSLQIIAPSSANSLTLKNPLFKKVKSLKEAIEMV